jgi:mono/diheme cytochrome c family protein
MSAMRGLATVGVVLLAVACGGPSGDRASGPRPRTPGPRMSMHDLHRMGGVPRGWKLTPPAGDVASGRALFVDFGCHSCHRVEGEPFSAKPGMGEVGPDLTGMGAHHPAAYFAEAILNPDAILIEGPGYIGPNGHSTMPDYPDMTLQQLGDLVAYLKSLDTGGAHAGHAMPPAQPDPPREAPAAADSRAKEFFIQSYDVKPGQLAAFEAWWKEQGARRFLAFDGLVSVDTFVDYTREQNPFTSVFGFRDERALQRFMQDPEAEVLGVAFDAFIGEHGHDLQSWRPMYRVPSLSTPAS